MEELHRIADKLFTEVNHLERAMQAGSVELAVAAAKRVRRDSTLLIRHLAEIRDNAIAEEAQAHEHH